MIVKSLVPGKENPKDAKRQLAMRHEPPPAPREAWPPLVKNMLRSPTAAPPIRPQRRSRPSRVPTNMLRSTQGSPQIKNASSQECRDAMSRTT